MFVIISVWVAPPLSFSLSFSRPVFCLRVRKKLVPLGLKKKTKKRRAFFASSLFSPLLLHLSPWPFPRSHQIICFYWQLGSYISIKPKWWAGENVSNHEVLVPITLCIGYVKPLPHARSAEVQIYIYHTIAPDFSKEREGDILYLALDIRARFEAREVGNLTACAVWFIAGGRLKTSPLPVCRDRCGRRDVGPITRRRHDFKQRISQVH